MVRLQRRALVEFVRISRPAYLVAGVALYACGLAVADYLGLRINAASAGVGLVVIALVQLMTHYLLALDDWRYRPPPARPSATSEPIDPTVPAFSRTTPLLAAIVCGGLLAVVITAQLITAAPPLLAWLLFVVIFMIGFWLAVPPLSLRTSGYGELLASVALALLVPSYAFALQTGETHRMVLLSLSPLVAVHFSLLIAQELEGFSAATAQKRRNFMVRAGWRTAMQAHDLSLAVAALLFAFGFSQGVPLRVSAGALLLLPLGLLQVWQMYRIRQGFPPAWRLLGWNAMGLFGLGIYTVLVGYLLS